MGSPLSFVVKGDKEMIDYFERKLRCKDTEVWDVRFGEDLYRMFIVDENRTPTVEDLRLPDSVETEEDLRANLITVRIYSDLSIKEEHIEHLDQFAKQLTDHVALAYCHVVVTFYTDEIDDVFDCFIKEQFNLEYDKIPMRQLWHLNQD